MASVVSRTFKSGNSDAVRLPKGLGFGVGVAVRIERVGDRMVIRVVPAEVDPAVQRLRILKMVEDINTIAGVTVIPRGERDVDWWPERPGL
jgi:antitoxin VapB